MRVVVVMSTFNGERFVGEQVESILSQLPPEGRLLIRDDGSSDATAGALAAMVDARIALTRGENIGFAASFFRLLDSVPADAEMVMLSDQDDVWLPARIERAWRVLQQTGDEPVLYCSRMRLVDEQLQPLGLSRTPARGPSFDNALAENIVTGCTVALNPAALRIASPGAGLARVHFHDWWLYLVVAAFGRVVFDPEPTVLYRQHGNNVIGMGSGLARYRAMLRFLRRRNWVQIMFMQVEQFRALHAPALDAGQRRLLERYFDPHDWRAVARLLFAARRFQQSLVSEALFRGLLLACLASGKGLLPRARRGQANTDE
jgi:glycosyltransferase involved in cell wall biosynthesis